MLGSDKVITTLSKTHKPDPSESYSLTSTLSCPSWRTPYVSPLQLFSAEL